jgi:hypothetical protein
MLQKVTFWAFRQEKFTRDTASEAILDAEILIADGEDGRWCKNRTNGAVWRSFFGVRLRQNGP